MQRKFKCIGTEETNMVCWGHNFEEGKVYEEKGGYATEGTLLLVGFREDGDPISKYVDADQFEEVKENVWGKSNPESVFWGEVKGLFWALVVILLIALAIAYFTDSVVLSWI